MKPNFQRFDYPALTSYTCFSRGKCFWKWNVNALRKSTSLKIFWWTNIYHYHSWFRHASQLGWEFSFRIRWWTVYSWWTIYLKSKLKCIMFKLILTEGPLMTNKFRMHKFVKWYFKQIFTTLVFVVMRALARPKRMRASSPDIRGTFSRFCSSNVIESMVNACSIACLL